MIIYLALKNFRGGIILSSYEIIIEMMNPCGGKAHSYVRIIEAELESPMDYVLHDTDGCEITETVNDDGSVVIETSRDGYIKRYTFSKT